MTRNQVTWPKDQRASAEATGVGLFAIARETAAGARGEIAGPSSPAIDAIIQKAFDDIAATIAKEESAELSKELPHNT